MLFDPLKQSSNILVRTFLLDVDHPDMQILTGAGISFTVYYAETDWKSVKTHHITTIVICIVAKSVKIC